jgi:chromosome segregation ATPase
MSDESKISVTLRAKIEQLLVKYKELQLANERLTDELARLRDEAATKDARVSELENELNSKSSETDELLGKIESVLGL